MINITLFNVAIMVAIMLAFCVAMANVHYHYNRAIIAIEGLLSKVSFNLITEPNSDAIVIVVINHIDYATQHPP